MEVTEMEPLMTAKDVQAYLKVSRSTLYLMLARNELPEPIRVSRQAVRWDPEEIRARFRRGDETGA